MEHERYDTTAESMYQVISEERFRRYTIKCMRHEGMESLWVFRNDVLQGVMQWTEMLQLGTDYQFVLRFPSAIKGLVFAEWVPEDTATQADLAVAISRLERYYLQAYPEDSKNGLMFRGFASLEVDAELDMCTVKIGGIPLVSFVADTDGMRLIDCRSARKWGYASEFETLLEPDVSEAMIDVADYVYEYLVSLLPPHGVAVH